MTTTSNKLTATIVGASGLVGSQVLNLLLKDSTFDHVRVIVRKPLTITHVKLEQIVIDFEDLTAYSAAIAGSTAVFCAVGTTLKKVNSDKVAYRKIDYDIPVHAAQFAKEHNCEHFSLISAVGANPASGNFYLKLKGEVERDIQKLNISSVAYFRPSFLLGDRKEFRLGEVIGLGVFKLFSFLIPSKYKAVKDTQLASAMLYRANQKANGTAIYHYNEITK